jgi:hypothetical protein
MGSLNPTLKSILWAVVRPLASRKVRVALATVIGAYIGDRFGLSTEMIGTILGVGVAVTVTTAAGTSGSAVSSGSILPTIPRTMSPAKTAPMMISVFFSMVPSLPLGVLPRRQP